MAKKSTAPKKAASAGGPTVRYVREHASDPLFVPHIEVPKEAALKHGEPVDFSALLESICGAADDSQPVEQYNGALGVTTAFVVAHQGAVCQVQWNNNLAAVYTHPGNVSGVRWGTGTMIAGDLMPTCAHLFDQTGGGWQRPQVNGTNNVISPQEIAHNMHVNFNYQVDAAGNLRQEQSFPILELLEYRLGGLDMAICRIGGNPGATFGITGISTTDAVVPDMLCIIGHPVGQPKRIEAGPTSEINGNLIRYGDIDTQGGNSGSGILRANDGLLVGIHTNGGCTPTSPGNNQSNFGQRIEAVIAASPTLQRLTTPINPTIKEMTKDPITDPTRKELFKDPIKDIIKEPIVEPIKLPNKDFRKDGSKDPLLEPVKSPIKDIREPIGPILDPRINPAGLGQGVQGGAVPFVMASPSRAAAGTEAAAAAQHTDALAQLSVLEQAIAALDQQRAELVRTYVALAQSAGLM